MQNWEQILINHVSNKGLVSWILNKLQNLTVGKQKPSLKNRQNIW